MRKFFFSALFVILLTVLPTVSSLSAKTPQDADKSVGSIESAVPNPYSSAMANLVADFVVKNGVVVKTKKIAEYVFYIKEKGSSRYSLRVKKHDNERMLAISYFATSSFRRPTWMVIDFYSSGNFSFFVDQENFFFSDKFLRGFGKEFDCLKEKTVELQKEYDAVLSKIVDCLRALKK